MPFQRAPTDARAVLSPLPSSLPSMDIVNSVTAVCQAPSTVETSLGYQAATLVTAAAKVGNTAVRAQVELIRKMLGSTSGYWASGAAIMARTSAAPVVGTGRPCSRSATTASIRSWAAVPWRWVRSATTRHSASTDSTPVRSSDSASAVTYEQADEVGQVLAGMIRLSGPGAIECTTQMNDSVPAVRAATPADLAPMRQE
ncbi:hypothetical protein OG225_07015 [Nocardia sp. NBC_01377]